MLNFIRQTLCLQALLIFLQSPVQARANEDPKLPPACLGSYCVVEKVLNEAELKKRLGGQMFNIGHRSRGYCYEQQTKGQKSQVLFTLKNHGDDWEVVSIRASSRKICKQATKMKQQLQLKTGEGVSIGQTMENVYEVYGKPSHKVTTETLNEVMRSNVIRTDMAIQYVNPNPEILHSAIFVFSNRRLIAIEVSSDE